MNEKIKIYDKIDLDDKTNVLAYHKKLLAEALKEKDELKTKVENWHSSSKNLSRLLNTQMSANDKFWPGFVTSDGMHVVPPPMTGNYMPSGPDVEIDDSKFTYGPKQQSSVESLECLPEQVCLKGTQVACELKVWTDAPIIEEYESDSDDDCVSIPLKETEQPSFAVDSDKHVKTSRENVKDKHTHSQYLKVNKKDLNESKRVGLGYCFTRRACFVCGSFSHLIRDCDYHEKRMAKQVELNKQKMAKGNGSAESKPKWNNVQRMNHQNQFVPTVVLTRTGRIPVNTTRPSSTNKLTIPEQTATGKGTSNPLMAEEVEETLGIPISKEIPSIDELEPQLLPNSSPLDVILGEKRGPKPPIKPHSPDSFRMKVVDHLTIHTPPLPHVASFHPKNTCCYYHPCIDDLKNIMDLNQVIFDEKKLGSS
ncbi:hypothetical protein Tco_1005719 [Tanacetum coccineum]|uniref:CCHC-type domain-containing protein n=1 Tax=Tanacetum coccineum TaxID=301880 RepID=A0ABQ5FFV3_9ASTR